MMVSRTADDVRGSVLRAWLEGAGVGVEAVSAGAPAPTGYVEVAEGPEGPVYDIKAPAAWDFLEAGPAARAAVRGARVFVGGTLAQRHPAGRRAWRELAALARECGAVIFIDLNLRRPFFDEEVVLWCLRQADVLKMTVGELETVSGLLGARGDRGELFAGLLREFGLPRAILTDGAAGAWFHEDGVTWHEEARPVSVVDTVGCGDAVTAVAAVALARGATLRAVSALSMEAAAHVASVAGATPK